MEASQEPEPRPSKPDRVFLSPEVIELHLRLNMPIEPEKAKWIWLMNHSKLLDGNSETTDGGW